MSDKILKLSQAQTLYQDLRERVDALPTNEDIPEVPVQDVQVNGVSVLNNGVANIPLGNNSSVGVVRGNSMYGISIQSNGIVMTSYATEAEIKKDYAQESGGTLTNLSYKPITPRFKNSAVFYGLALAAGDTTQSASSNAVGTYTPEAKGAIQNMLGITDLISTEESSTATAAHALNSTFMMNGKLHRATAAIAIGDAVEVGTNCEVVKADEVFIKNTDIASNNTFGVIKVDSNYGLKMNNGIIQVSAASSASIKSGKNATQPITASNQNESVFYGLSKVAGVDLANETVTLGTYPEASKTAIRSLIGAGTPLDVQVNGASIVSSGVANIPLASSSTTGCVRVDANNGIAINSNTQKIYIDYAGLSAIKAATDQYRAITPKFAYAATFYGLAKAAGDITQDASDNAVGTYTADASAAIRSMLGTVGANDVATATTFGLVKVNASMSYGMALDNNGILRVNKASSEQIKEGAVYYMPLVPYTQHESVFYGLSKVAGVDLANETVTLGTYPATASAAIRSMLGAVGDVQVNGTSVVSNGVATIPLMGTNTYGVAQVSGSAYGIGTTQTRYLYILSADTALNKAGTHAYRPLTPSVEDSATFYGLAKAAGDTTMASSSNAVGTYTDNAKASIKAMLGIQDGSTGTVDVSGTTPTITAVENTRYVCGEITSLDFTPPASGISIVRFTSGSTVTVLTIPSTVKFPEWFDPTSLETNTIYEICVTDGEFGAVMSWAL